MFCPECTTELILLKKDSWANDFKCIDCGNRYRQIFPDRMGGIHRQYDLEVFDRGFTFEHESIKAQFPSSNNIDLRD